MRQRIAAADPSQVQVALTAFGNLPDSQMVEPAHYLSNETGDCVFSKNSGWTIAPVEYAQAGEWR